MCVCKDDICFKEFPLTDALVSGFSCAIFHHEYISVCVCMCQTVMPVCKQNTKHLTMTSFEQRLLMVNF